MVNTAFLVEDFWGLDVLYKAPLVSHLDRRHKIFVASRVQPIIHLSKELRHFRGDTEFNEIQQGFKSLSKESTDFFTIYDSLYLKKKYSQEEIGGIQAWLGVSFKYLSSLDRRFYNRKKMVDVRDQNNIENYFAGLAFFLKDFFIKNDIKILIKTLEDTAFSVVAFYAAKKLQLEVLGIASSRFPKKGLWFMRDFVDICVWNDDEVEWRQIEELYEEMKIVGVDRIAEKTAYYKIKNIPSRFKDAKTDILLYNSYVKYLEKQYSCERLIHEKHTIRSGIRSYAAGLIRSKTIKMLSRRPSSNVPYFLFPLHFLDDAQITFREPFLNQFEQIKYISRALPYGYNLYVKPHPHFLGSDVFLREIVNLAKLRNVMMIDPIVPIRPLIRSSKGVITVNSTAGFEALIYGVPVITFGHDFYCKNSLCRVIRDLNDLAQTLYDVINNVSLPKRDSVQEYIKTVYANTVWLDPSYNFYSTLSEADAEKIAYALNSLLLKIENNQ
jgi:capsule polysaccharide modification protein KpsS